MSKDKIVFNFGDHTAIFGGTGSGKTTLAKEMLKMYARGSELKLPIYIIDSKAQGDFDGFSKKGIGVHYFGNDLPPLKNKDGSPFVIWTPESDSTEMYDSFFQMIYEGRKKGDIPSAVVFIDELSSITGRTGIPPRYYDILLKQGRGMGLSVITLSQMARFVPLTMTSQLMHVFMMNLNSEKDKKKLEDVLGDMAKQDVQHRHGFVYRDVRKPIKSNPPFYYKDLKEFFGK